jgi:hypothetical protein
VIRAIAIIRAITPIVIPRVEIEVITEINACFRLAVRYRLATNHS